MTAKQVNLILTSLKVIKVESARLYDSASGLAFELEHDSKVNLPLIKELRSSMDRIEFHLTSLEKL